MSAIKDGKKRESFEKELWSGFATVRPVAVCPSREELNKLFGKDDDPEDKPKEYLGTDKEGNDRVRLEIWLQDLVSSKYYVWSNYITRKPRITLDGKKVQLINQTCWSTYCPILEGTDADPDTEQILDSFQYFTNKKTKETIGKKKWWVGQSGEAELCDLVQAWLGDMNFFGKDTDVKFDMDAILKEDFTELRDLLNSDFATPFTILLGVETDADDSTKKYQKIWKKFLPNGFVGFIKKNKFPDEYKESMWKRFKTEVAGDHGFKAYFELEPVAPYDADKDPLNSSSSNVDEETLNYGRR